MSDLVLNFDARTVKPAAPFEPLPTAWYNVRIVGAEPKPTKDSLTDGSGDYYLELTMEVIDGQFANRKVFDRLNLQNKNPTAVEIAQRTLSAICHATGVLQVRTPQDLFGYPLQARVVLKPARTDAQTGQTYEASNDVKGYKAVEGGSAAVASAGTPAWAQGGTAPAPVAQPASPATPAPTPASPPSYKVGDVVNGHQLTAQGTWVPVPATPPPAPPVAAPPPAPPAPPAYGAGAPPAPPVTAGGQPWATPPAPPAPPAAPPAGGPPSSPPWAR